MEQQGYVSIFDLIPGYKEAVAKENVLRDADFLSNTTSIFGVEVYKLTPRLMSILTLMENPLVTGGKISLADVLMFLYIISRDFSKDNDKRKVFLENIVKQILNDNDKLDQLVKEVDDYLENTFADSVKGRGHKEVSYVSNLASIVDIFSHEYGWDENKVFDMPYRRIWQYLRAITLRHDPKTIFGNPSDVIKERFMGQLNG